MNGEKAGSADEKQFEYLGFSPLERIGNCSSERFQLNMSNNISTEEPVGRENKKNVLHKGFYLDHRQEGISELF